MVCLGNICRSPLAEGILASKLPKDKFFVDSCGTGKWHIGKQPDDRSIAVAKKNGLDISSQKCRQFHKSDFDTFDYIYVMDANNYSDVMAMAQNQTQKDKVDYILNELFANENVDVPDPFYGLPNGFDNVYEMLDEVGTLLANKLLGKHL